MAKADDLQDIVDAVRNHYGVINIRDNITNNIDIINGLVNDFDQYIAYLNSPQPTQVYQDAWDSLLYARIKKLCFMTIASKTLNSIAEVRTMLSTWQYERVFPYGDLNFGQIRVGPNFAGEHDRTPARLQGLGGSQISMTSFYRLFEGNGWPISIFHNGAVWVALNNRGLLVHCIRDVKPLRLIPRLATVDETNRLNERENHGTIPLLTYEAGFAHGLRLNVHKHSPRQDRTLPSRQMPITDGPNSWVIKSVVTIPANWN